MQKAVWRSRNQDTRKNLLSIIVKFSILDAFGDPCYASGLNNKSNATDTVCGVQSFFTEYSNTLVGDSISLAKMKMVFTLNNRSEDFYLNECPKITKIKWKVLCGFLNILSRKSKASQTKHGCNLFRVSQK